MSAEDIEIEDKPPRLTVERLGGPEDGEKFFLVDATFKDGTKATVWISNIRDGVFRQAFVPWEFKHPDVIC